MGAWETRANLSKRSRGDAPRKLRAAGARFGVSRPRALEKTLYTALPVFTRFHARHSARQIDHELLAPQHIRALGHDDRIACQRDGVAFHIEDAEFPGGGLILLRDDNTPTRLQTLDALFAAWTWLALRSAAPIAASAG